MRRALTIPKHVFELDGEKIAEALMIPLPQLTRLFRDGRVASKFVEEWATSLFGVTKHANSNHPSSDAFGKIADEVFEFSIRTLTWGGIRFQDSKYIGCGRSCNMADLKASIRRTDRWLVFDIRRFPEVAAYKLKTSTIEKWIDAGKLTPSGLTSEKFETLVEQDGVIVNREFCFD